MDIKNNISDTSRQIFEEIRDIRRQIHSNPELSFEENETSALVCRILDKYGIAYRSGFAKTGVLGRIDGVMPGKKVIALRADMDALPIQEQNALPYCSRNPGKMHACGHDIHTASLLGTAIVLQQLREHFGGTILLVFQPGEERLPGGASLLLAEGALANPKPDLILGQHVQPNIEAGKTGFRPGLYMASDDEIYVKVTGRGGHAALPHELTDPVLISAHIIVALQQIVSRHAKASIPSVLSFGKVEAKGSTNIIPNDVTFEGTFRTMDEPWRAEAHAKMIKMAEGIAEGMGGHCEFRIEKGYPFLVNHEASTLQAKAFAQEYLGQSNVLDLDLRMTAEDFAWYSHQFPAVFYRLGVKPRETPNPAGLHSPFFVADEDALKTGMATMAWLAIRFLE